MIRKRDILNILKSVRTSTNNNSESDYILSLCEDFKGNLWIGTRGNGLIRMRFALTGQESFVKYKHNPVDPESLGANNVHYIYEDNDKTLWIGTGGGGLNRFNPQSNTFTRFVSNTNVPGSLSDNWVYNILEDKSGNLWLGTAAGGLNLFDRENGTFKYFMHDPSDPLSLSNNHVLSLLESESGILWIGTALGLNKLVYSGGGEKAYTFENFYEKDGLPNDVIYGIVEDDSGNLWISTSNGLCSATFSKGSINARTYKIEDGLQHNEFDQNSFARGKDGKMYFGGINGLNVFHPDSVFDNSYIPPVELIDFKILNESIPILKNSTHNISQGKESTEFENQNVRYLPKALSYVDTIEISYEENVISFEFAALNYTTPEKNLYSYYLEGFDKDWIHSGTRRFVTYTNLDAGTYKFRVRGSNNDGIWNDADKSIMLIVTPPPWAEWWAKTIYVLLLIYGGFLLIRKREKAVKQKIKMALIIDKAKAEERETVRKKASQDFHDEAGNKLTKIRLFTTLAKRECSADFNLNKYLTNIEENISELSNGMRDFLWVLDVGKDSLFDMIKRLEEFGNSMFEFSDTNFKVIGVKEEFRKIVLSIEVRRTLILIYKEAMNNSLKYSGARSVTLFIELKNELLSLILTDNGKGFDSEIESNGYGINNMKARAESINGKLNVESGIDTGTKIFFTGNITHMGN